MSKRILVVDDEHAILFAYKRLLQLEGFNVDVCATYYCAIAMINGNNYDYVLSDIRLGDSDNIEGLDILKYVNENEPSIKVIIATGYGNEATKEQALKMGVKHYFEKPVDTRKLLMLLKE